MHNYTTDTDIRPKITRIIVFLSIGIALLVALTLNSFGIVIMPLNITFSSVIKFLFKLIALTGSSFFALQLIYDKFLWKTKIMQLIHHVPNLNGTWIGDFVSKKKDENGIPYKGTCKMIIEQTWTKIKVTCYFNKSTSDSQTATINIQGSNGVELKFEYYNKAEKTTDENMKAHTGMNTLRYIKEENRLVGDYYSDKNRGNSGTLEVCRVISETAEQGA